MICSVIQPVVTREALRLAERTEMGQSPLQRFEAAAREMTLAAEHARAWKDGGIEVAAVGGGNIRVSNGPASSIVVTVANARWIAEQITRIVGEAQDDTK